MMKKLAYIVTFEYLNKASFRIGIAIREKDTGDLNAFFPIMYTDNGDDDSDVVTVPFSIFLHLQSLVNVYGASIEWNLTEKPIYPC